MRSRCSTIIALLAWLFATGSQWDLVQTFAWGRMIATYAQTMSVTQAMQRTFTADNLCGICKTVSRAKQEPTSTHTAPTNPADGKILLALTSPPAVIVGLVELSRFTVRSAQPYSCDRSPPLSEPPRAV